MDKLDLKQFEITLSEGAHLHPKEGMCVMECVAYIMGEVHTDHPMCADPIIGCLAIRMNDSLPSAYRQRLLQYVLRIAGSSTDKLPPAEAGRIKQARIDAILRFEDPMFGSDTNEALYVAQSQIAMRLKHMRYNKEAYEAYVDSVFNLLDELLKLTDDLNVDPTPPVVQKLRELEDITAK